MQNKEMLEVLDKSVPTHVLRLAIAKYISDLPRHVEGLPQFYQNNGMILNDEGWPCYSTEVLELCSKLLLGETKIKKAEKTA